MRRLLIVGLAVAAVAPATAGAGGFKGTVVAKLPAKHAVAVAQPNGVVRTAHVSKMAALGTRVAVAGHSVKTVGRASHAHVRGTLVRRTAGAYLVSAGGVTMRIARGARQTASVGSAPKPGSKVDATVGITSSGLVAEKMSISSADTEEVEVEGTVSAVSSTSLSVLADDGTTTTFTVPAGFDVSGVKVGDSVDATGEVLNGVLTLTGLEIDAPDASPAGTTPPSDDDDPAAPSDDSGDGSGDGSGD
jgi:hypothetical protein